MADFTVTYLHPSIDENGALDPGENAIEYHGDDTFTIEANGVLVVSARHDGQITRAHVAPHAWKSVKEHTHPEPKPRVDVW